MSERPREHATPDCIPVEKMGAVLEREPNDPARRHLDSCPRCRSVARELASFLEEQQLSAADGSAVLGIEEALAAEIGAAPGRESAAWWRNMGWQPALAAAAAVLAVVVTTQVMDREPGDGIVLRNTGEATTVAFAGEPTATLSVEGDESVVEFHWTAQDGAHGYRVEVYGAGLERIATIAAGSATSARWAPGSAQLPDGAVPTAWRVLVLEDGDVVRQSDVLPYSHSVGSDAGR